MYYSNKIEILKEIFNTTDILYQPGYLKVGGNKYPIIDDVIILSPENKHSDFVRDSLNENKSNPQQNTKSDFAEDIQYSFGEEWKDHDKIYPEHEDEFRNYFDIVDTNLESSRICDLGCGNGRWSYFLQDMCKEIILVDFSDAIFVARKNLLGADNCLFFMCDLKVLPFKDKFADLLISVGVLHHLPTPCLDEVRRLEKFAPSLFIYLYYSLENRPFYFRLILIVVTVIRLIISRFRNRLFRKTFSKLTTIIVYLPLIYLSRLFKFVKLNHLVPLDEFYDDKSISRIEQDVYDRFFTRIEQRVSRKDILELNDTFSSVVISNRKPYWHFICKK
jgi:SAM-dependent methyltransferase